MPSWWSGPTRTGFGLVCEWDARCQAEALVLAWIRDADGQWNMTVLCLEHLAALAFPQAVAA